MADNAALTAVLQQIAQVLTNIQGQVQPQVQAPTPVLDPFATDDVFDLASRAGDPAYKRASSPIDPIWNGSTTTFLAFVTSLKIRAREVRWDVAGDTGITTFGAHDLFDDYVNRSN